MMLLLGIREFNKINKIVIHVIAGILFTFIFGLCLYGGLISLIAAFHEKGMINIL